jgi:hypothetical protein
MPKDPATANAATTYRFNSCWPRDQSASDLQADQYRHLKQIRQIGAPR